MRMKWLALVVALTMVLAVGTVTANNSVAQKATGDVVRYNGNQTWHTVFEAHAPVDMFKGDVLFKTRPAKGTASGERIDPGSEGWWTIDVTCAESLGVDDEGRLGFRFAGPTTSSNTNRPYIVIEVWDAGSPGSEGDEMITGVYQTGTNLCDNVPGSSYPTILEGNLVVHTDLTETAPSE